jgi:hypothetical protein
MPQANAAPEVALQPEQPLPVDSTSIQWRAAVMAHQARQAPRIIEDVQVRLRAEVDRHWVQTSLASWMVEHQSEFEQLLRSGLTWEAAAMQFAAAGLLDAGGRPSGTTAAETWRRVGAVAGLRVA